MQGSELQDLEEGRNEWCNIPSAIRNSISRFNQLILAQSQYTHILETKLNEQQNRINEQQLRMNEQQNFIQELETNHEQFTSLTQSALDTVLTSFSNFSRETHRALSRHDFKEVQSQQTALHHSVQEVQQLVHALERTTDSLGRRVDEQQGTMETHFTSSSQLEHQLLSIANEMSQMNDAIQGKASKASVSAVLKKKVTHEELDEAVQQVIGEVSGILKKHEIENEERWKNTTNKILEMETTRSRESPVDAPPMVLLERQISKNCAELNRMVLDLDRTELQQVEEMLENHFKLISGISNELADLRHSRQSNEADDLQDVRQSIQHIGALTEAQQTSVIKMNKALQDINKSLSSKADKEEITQSVKTIVTQVDKQLQEIERMYDRTRITQKPTNTTTTAQLEELLKLIESKADREDVTRISKIIVDIEASNHRHQEDEERKQAWILRNVRSEVDKYARSELERTVRAEVEVFVHSALERKEAEWKDERQEELAVKANLAELHQVRKETTELASRILSFSKELHDLQASFPRRMETLLLSREAESANNPSNAKSDLQLRVALDQLHDELVQLKAKLKKKVEKGEIQDMMKAWQCSPDSSTMPSSPTRGKNNRNFVTKEELMELLKQKVDFSELMNSLSLKIDRNDLHTILNSPDFTTKPEPTTNQDIRGWVEHVMLQLEQSLHDKVGMHELAELREQIHKKLDVTVFVHTRTEIEDNIRKIDRDLRDIYNSMRIQRPTSTATQLSPKKNSFLNQANNTNLDSRLETPSPTLSASTTGTEGRWFKDVKPPRYLEILEKLNNMKGNLKGD